MNADGGRFDPHSVFAVLNRHRVRYVVIGGIANTFHGSPYPTYDLDITPSTDKRNLSALAAALTDLEARELNPPKVVLEPAGTKGYSDLARRLIIYEVEGEEVPVAHLEDIIRSKEAAGRERDLAQLPTLRKLLERFAPG